MHNALGRSALTFGQHQLPDQTFMALAGRLWMDETRGRRPLMPVALIAAASAKIRLVLEP